jgi:hypothetical protein
MPLSLLADMFNIEIGCSGFRCLFLLERAKWQSIKKIGYSIKLSSKQILIKAPLKGAESRSKLSSLVMVRRLKWPLCASDGAWFAVISLVASVNSICSG